MRWMSCVLAGLLTLGGSLWGYCAAQATLTGVEPSEATLRAVPERHVVRPGAVVPDTPEELNASITFRFGAARPRAILLLMPGFVGGAGSFDRLARQIVALDPSVAVWTVDRRSNLLEPQLELARADQARLVQIVQRGLPAREPGSVAFMQSWGLDTTLRDWRAAVLEARTLTPNVFIGGHSLGGVLTGLYASYDFVGQPGFKDVRGLIMLDGVPEMSSIAPVTLEAYQRGSRTLVGTTPGLNGLAANPYLNVEFFNPVMASRAAAQARLMAFRPDAPAPVGGLTDFPATNLAAGLLQLEQRYALLPFTTIRTGRPSNAREVRSLTALALGWDSYRVIGPLDPGRPVGWQSDPAAPVDALDFAGRFWRPLTDYTEWYFPNRLTLDVSAVGVGTRGTPFESQLPVWHTRSVTTPILGIAAQYGLTKENDYRRYAALTYAAVTTHTLPGAAHLDITAARKADVARWILDWMRSLK